MTKEEKLGEYIIVHKGFNREKRRHDSSVQLFTDEAIKVGFPIPKNKPYTKKGK